MRLFLIMIFSMGLLTACASKNSIFNISGLERIYIEQEMYEKPEFFLGKFDFTEKPNKGRAPASTYAIPPTKLSNRQIYFISFYRQYLKMSKLLNNKETIKSCPRFHNLLANKVQLSSVNTSHYSTNINLASVQNNKSLAGINPILAIPISEYEDLYTALTRSNWKDPNVKVLKALNHYYQTTQKEIVALCDRGVSSGYYVYENLVTYFKTSIEYYQTRKGLQALLKVPVLANMLVLDNLASSGEKNIYDQRLLKRTNALWFNKYLNTLKQKRSQLVNISDEKSYSMLMDNSMDIESF